MRIGAKSNRNNGLASICGHTEYDLQLEENTMNQEYYDAVTKMEGMDVDPEYV